MSNSNILVFTHIMVRFKINPYSYVALGLAFSSYALIHCEMQNLGSLTIYRYVWYGDTK